MEFASYKKLINPDTKPYHLVGFGDDRQSNETYFGVPELYLKICWIKSEAYSLIFVTVDTLYFSKEFTSKLISFATQKYQIAPDAFIFNASHTHSAPNISMPLWAELNTTYFQKVEEAFYNGINHCAQQLKPGHIVFENIEPETPLFISRRKKTISPSHPFKRHVKRLPNYSTQIDQNLRLIKIYNSQREVEVVLYNFACHPVFNRNDEFSSDFVGDISKRLEEHVPVALFLQGFCGDIRANFTGKLSFKTLVNLFRDKAFLSRNLALAVKLIFYREIFIPYTKEFYNSFVDTLYNLIKSAVDRPLQHSSTTLLSIKNGSFTSTLYSQTHQTCKQFRTRVLSIGTNIIVSIPAEVNSYYYSVVENYSNGNVFLPLGYSDDMICYLPGAEEIEDGGYEVDSFKQYELDSPLSKQSLLDYRHQLEASLKKLCDKNE